MGSPIEVRRGGIVICTWKDESCANEPRIIKDMKANDYKFYQDGKIYKWEKKEETEQN